MEIFYLNILDSIFGRTRKAELYFFLNWLLFLKLISIKIQILFVYFIAFESERVYYS